MNIWGGIVGALVASSALILVSFVRRPHPTLAQRVLPYTDRGWKPARPALVGRAVR